MSNRDDFEEQARELGEMFLNQAMNKATVDMVRDDKFIPRITDELWNAYVAGQESVDTINEVEPIAVSHDYHKGGDTRLHVEQRGERSLMFANIGERQAALGILREWKGKVELLESLGRDLADNGRSLAEYGGPEGRIREHVGMEIEQWAQLLRMRCDADAGSISMANMQELLEKRVGKFIEEKESEIAKEVLTAEEINKEAQENADKANEAFRKFDEENPPVEADPGGMKAEAEARLAVQRRLLSQVECEDCIEENIEFRRKVLRDIKRCEGDLKRPVRGYEVTMQETLDKLAADHNTPIDVRARFTAYQGMLVVETIGDPSRGKDIDGWYPKTEKRWGPGIDHTKARLEISQEAIEVMRAIPRNNDDVGDLMWRWKDDGTCFFSWWGGHYRIFDPWDAEAARGFRVWPGQYIECENDVPEQAKKFIDQDVTDDVTWREPVNVP